MIVEAIRDQVHAAGGMLDCHLMVERPERQIDQFCAAGADSITIQAEATPNVHYTLQQIRNAGCLAGLAINPGTPVEAVEEVLDAVDFILCMTVNPGWGGQAFIETSPAKVMRLRALVGPELPIQVDGGIGPATAGQPRRGRDAVRRRLRDLRRRRSGRGLPRDRGRRRRRVALESAAAAVSGSVSEP